MDMSQYLEIFIEESKEHLQAMNQSLLQLEKNPSDTSMVNEIFRAAHTLKGMSGTMGFTHMSTLTHDMEDVLHAIRNNEMKVTSKLVDVLFSCLDALENYVQNIISSGTEGTNDYQNIINILKDIMKNKGVVESTQPIQSPVKETKAQPSVSDESEISVTSVTNGSGEFNNLRFNQYEQNVINKAIDLGMHAFQIGIRLNPGCVLKSARSFIIFQTLEKYGEIIKSEPRVEDIEDEKFDLQFEVAVVSKKDADTFKKELDSIAEVDLVVVNPLSRMSSEGSVENLPMQSTTTAKSETASITEEHPVTENATPEASKASGEADNKAKPRTGKTVRVDIDRLDVLMNLVSELIISKTKLDGIDDIERSQKFNDEIEYLERITTSLHDAVMKVRMVPVETVFNRFPRMIRDISRDIGKEIVLTMSGEETELDRTVIDEIGDPLIHLLRNAADHGIESIESRRQSHKSDAGHVSLRAYQDGNNVVIEVEDDGAGINVERVKQKGIERGVVTKERADTLSQKDIIDFLFKPSFSTADKITDLSGRGVGLDVVKTKIETLGGAVEVETELGKGSKFIIRLPLTLAIIQALLVMIGQEKFAIPLNSVQQIINIQADEIKYVQKQEVILLRNMVVPLVRLNEVLEVPGETNKDAKQLTVVIVKKGEKLSGFLVDSLIGQQEIVIKSLGKLLHGIKSIAGATILGDGNVALIIDVNSIA